MSGWKDRSFPHGGEEEFFPFIQWANSGAALEPRRELGGFACPLDQGLEIPGERARLHHRNGESTEVIFADCLSVAVIRTRFAWVKDGHRQPAYMPGARGKLQALCLVRVPDANGEVKASELVMLTLSGVAGRFFQAAQRDFRAKVRQATKGKAPAYSFWMTIGAGDILMVGSNQQSPITSIVLRCEPDVDSDYIGDEAVDSLPWPTILSWAEAWRSPGVNGSGVISEADEDEEDGAPPAGAGTSSAPAEGTLEWAEGFPLPFKGHTVDKGTPLGELSDAALEALAGKSGEYPEAARAAGIIRHGRQKQSGEARQQAQPTP
jgi:hypothetical protein